MKTKLVVLTGAGISAESGIKTFRDSDGLWEGYEVMTVASIEGWNKNPALVLDFYNQRRKQLLTVNPNTAHLLLAELQDLFELSIITQNVDDLHERAGSLNAVSYTHLRAHETVLDLVCRLLLEKNKQNTTHACYHFTNSNIQTQRRSLYSSLQKSTLTSDTYMSMKK